MLSPHPLLGSMTHRAGPVLHVTPTSGGVPAPAALLSPPSEGLNGLASLAPSPPATASPGPSGSRLRSVRSTGVRDAASDAAVSEGNQTGKSRPRSLESPI